MPRNQDTRPSCWECGKKIDDDQLHNDDGATVHKGCCTYVGCVAARRRGGAVATAPVTQDTDLIKAAHDAGLSQVAIDKLLTAVRAGREYSERCWAGNHDCAGWTGKFTNPKLCGCKCHHAAARKAVKANQS